MPVAFLGGEDRTEVGVGGGIVDEDVDAAEGSDGLLNECVYGATVAGMCGHGQRAAATGPD